MPFKSNHPHHTKTSLPFGLFRRICLIVEDSNKKNNRLEEMHNFLLQRGYPTNILIDAKEKALQIPQETLRSYKKINEEGLKNLPIVLTFNPKNYKVKEKINAALETLSLDDRLGQMLESTKILWSYRQPPNLGKILCPSKLISKPLETGQCMVRKCGGSRCEVCDLIKSTNIVTFENGQEYAIKTSMNCNSLNVIYMIKCRICFACYIGETNDFRLRANNHKKDVRNECHRKLQVNKHIFICSGKNCHFDMMPIYKCPNDNFIERKTMEKLLIKKFNPSLNSEE